MLSLSCYIRMCWTFRTYQEGATFLDRDVLASYRHRVFLIRQDRVGALSGRMHGLREDFSAGFIIRGNKTEAVEDILWNKRPCGEVLESLHLVVQHQGRFEL